MANKSDTFIVIVLLVMLLGIIFFPRSVTGFPPESTPNISNTTEGLSDEGNDNRSIGPPSEEDLQNLEPLTSIEEYYQNHAWTEQSFHMGVSGYAKTNQTIDNMIGLLAENNFTTLRLSFSPEYYTRKTHPYNQLLINHFLEKSSYYIIVDRNHLYPPTEASASQARSNWATVKDSVFEVLQAFPNNSRVAVELINEYVSNDFYSRMQQLVVDIRSAGYTNPLIVNKWNQPWTIIKDPLNMTFQGYHFYFNSWSVKGALDQMATALKKGIKLICTEVGGDYREYKYFTADTVKKLGNYLSEAGKIGVGGIVWLNRLYESGNINTYRQLKLTVY